MTRATEPARAVPTSNEPGDDRAPEPSFGTGAKLFSKALQATPSGPGRLRIDEAIGDGEKRSRIGIVPELLEE